MRAGLDSIVVTFNLILNAVQAMDAVTNGTREVLITTSQTDARLSKLTADG